MDILRTPDERFAGLEDWPYESKYIDVGDGIRMAYVDEGPKSGPVVLLGHGEPTWGYLYRKMIPGLAAAGRRVIVPDLIGFGRSDKPTAREDYTYERHVGWCRDFIDGLGLNDITLFGQDWGGLLFLVLVGEQPKRFRAVVAANAALPDPDLLTALGSDAVRESEGAFLRWFEQSQAYEQFSASDAVGGADSALNQAGHTLTAGEAAAYDAPFPDESYCTGARQFPLLVPLDDTDPPASMLRRAWEGLRAYDKPFVTAFAEHEDVTRTFESVFQSQVAGATGQTHVTVPAAGHFLQEQQPEILVDLVLRVG
jgi:haloalkane dehalogenase